MSDTVLVEVSASVATVTLNRPHLRNAVDLPTATLLSRTIDDLEDRSDVRVIILTGAGGSFCSGMDLKAFAATGERPVVEDSGAFGVVERVFRKPVLAAVEGKALGGGFEIALACDLIVAATNAEFGLPEVSRGLMAAGGGVLRLGRRMPRNAGLSMVLTGRPLGAGQAHTWGLVTTLTEPGGALDGALDVAHAIAANAPLSIRTSKYIFDAAMDWPANEHFSRQAPYYDRIRASNDAAEGALAFVQKRAPRWTDS